jgi:hypothetical protein
VAVLHARVSNGRELRRLLDGLPIKGMFAAGFGVDGRMCGVAVNPRHRSLSWVKVWELAEIVTVLEACTLHVALYPAGPGVKPTAHECAVFSDLMVRAHRAAVPVVDCHVWRGERMWSLRELNERRISA